MLLRVLKSLLRASPLLLGLLFTMYLILAHGQRLALDGHAPLVSFGSRVLLSVGFALVVLLVLWLRRRRAAREPVNGVPEGAAPVELSERELALRDRLHTWHPRAGGQLPGFLLIGPAGLDKGLSLGLSDKAEGDLHCRTLGGFALFDISGNLLSQRQPEDARLWRLLLDELQQAGERGQRPRGVVLVLGAGQLQQASAAERDQLALTLRARLEELASRFGKGLALQVVISGCEQLPGYRASLAWLAADRRELSIEFAPATRNRQLLAGLGERMNGLIAGLDRGLFERLQREPDVQVRSMLFGFTPMWHGFAVTLQGVLETALAQERGIAQVALQSLRFSTQPGPAEAPAPALSRALQACWRPGRVRTALRQGLAWGRPRAHYLVLLATLLISLLLLTLHRDQGRRLEQVDQHIAALQQASVKAGMLNASSLQRLDRLAEISRLLEQRWRPWAADRQLRSRAAHYYAQGLQQHLLPDVLQRLQSHLREPSALGDESLRQSLGLYLMLGGEGRFDAQALRDWYAQARRAETGGALHEAQREYLDAHLQRLLEALAQSGPLPVDRALIEQARARLTAQPLAQRLYRQLTRQLERHPLADFSVASALGAEGLLVFARRSGEPQTRGVPGLFTLAGQQRLQRLIDPTLALALAQEHRLTGQVEGLAVAPLKQEMLALYHQAYIDHWEAFFADLQVLGLHQDEHLPRRLLQLAQPDSALLELLRAVGRETEWVPAPLTRNWLEVAQQQGSRLQQRIGLAAADPLLEPPEHPLTRHFRPLHQWLAAAADAPATEPLRGALKDAALFILAGQKAASLNVPVPANDALERLQAEVGQLPELLQPVLLDIVEVSQQRLQQQARLSLQTAWATEVAPFCERALSERYPFAGDSPNQVSLEDFNRLFATDGVLQGFEQQYLAGQLDTRSRPWRLAAPASLAISAPLLASLEQAAQVREVFFSAGQSQARFDFELSPLTMSERIAEFTLSLDDVSLAYRHGPLRPALFEWPGKALGAEARATVTLLDGRTLIRKTEGPWAWFRLLDQAQLIPTLDPEVRQVVLDFEGEEVRLQLRVGRVGAPFNRQGWSRFRCPAAQPMVSERARLGEVSQG